MATFTRENILSLLNFEGADLFDFDDSETVPYKDPIEALEEMLEASDLPFCGDVAKYLDTETLFLSVTAYKRMSVDDHERTRWPANLVEMLREWFGEEHGNQDGDDLLSDADIAELGSKMRDLVDWYLARVKVHSCEALRSWHFDNADILELVQQLRPDWLKVD